jgi:4-amino-4-deoxy-L-arabinose transferase-like glycosyltransferase
MLSPVWRIIRKRPLASACISALLIRVLLSFWLAIPMLGLTSGYIQAAASIASGRGPLMPAQDEGTVDVNKFLKSREDVGTRVSSNDPFPPDPRGWLPATFHPPGYSLLLFVLYRISNYSAMLWWVLRIQTILDALTCLLVYMFIRNLFGRDIGLIAAWIYALLPAPMLLCLQLLPDSLTCFFAAAMLASASYIYPRGLPAALATGLAIGIACLFRSEFLIWSAIIIVLLLPSQGTIATKLRWSGVLAVSQVAVLMPWILWTYRVTGHPLLTGSALGLSMYQSLGEIPANPWRITLDDERWVTADARKRGLRSAGDPEGDAYYRKLFLHSIWLHPVSFAEIVVTQRLPLALAPAYYMGGDMWFMNCRVNEGLTRWQAVRKYPGAAIRHEWLKFVMAFLSALLLAIMLYVCFLYRRTLPHIAWLWFPWIVMIVTVSLINSIQARFLASNLIVEVGAAGLLASKCWTVFRRIGKTTRT